MLTGLSVGLGDCVTDGVDEGVFVGTALIVGSFDGATVGCADGVLEGLSVTSQ